MSTLHHWKATPALTFGIELEFLVATLPPGHNDPHPLDPRPTNLATPAFGEPKFNASLQLIQWRIAEALRSYSIPALTTLELIALKQGTNEDEDSDSSSEKEMDPKDKEQELRSWIIDTDPTIKFPVIELDEQGEEPEEYVWFSIEVKSPPCYGTEESFKEAEAVVSILASRFRSSVNTSTGLHIHVGDGYQGMTVKTQKCLAAFIWTFGAQIGSVHPGHRRDGGMTTLEYNLDMEYTSNLHDGAEVEDLKRKGLETLLAMEESWEVLQAMEGAGKKEVYNFQGMVKSGKVLKQTIEFREHEGTLDPLKVVHWLRTCLGIVYWARDESLEHVETFCRKHIGKSVEEFELLDVLVELRLKSEALFYTLRTDQDLVDDDEDEDDKLELKRMSMGSSLGRY